MSDTGPGLRERKKRETARTIFAAAIRLFVEHGFDNVAVHQIATAANVSKMTVFNYFPSKEDLVMRPMEEHVGDAARAVRERAAGESAVEALLRDFLAGLERRDASTGLNDQPAVVGVNRLVRDTPALLLRTYAFGEQSRRLLARELAGGAPPAVDAQAAAAQLVGVRQALAAENARRVLAGESADAVYPGAVADAERVFGQARDGLGSRGRT